MNESDNTSQANAPHWPQHVPTSDPYTVPWQDLQSQPTQPQCKQTLRISTVLWGYGIYALTVFAAVVSILGFVLGDSSESTKNSAYAAFGAIHGVLCLAGMIILLRHIGATKEDVGLVKPTASMWHLLWQVPCIFIASSLALIGVAALLGMDEPASNVSSEEFQIPLPFVVLAFLGIAILAPIWEELFFRGIVFGAFRQRWNVPIAIVSSGVLFAVTHMAFPLLPAHIVMGIALGWLRYKHNNLWAPIIMHIANNSFVVLMVIAGL